MRKGRSVVHKNLEDNYGAVVVANHEALAQVLDQVCPSISYTREKKDLLHKQKKNTIKHLLQCEKVKLQFN